MDATTSHIRYCAETRAVLGASTLLVRNPVSGRTVVVDRDTTKVAAACGAFASMEEHCARLEAATGADRNQCKVSVQRAIDAGLFVSSGELARYLVNGWAPAAEPRKIDIVGIPTRNRPKLLNRVLEGLGRNLREYGRKATVIVVDDSETVSMQQANSHAIAAHSADPRMNIRCVDRESRKRLAAQLVRQDGLPTESVAFALGGSPDYPVSMGAARNTILMHSVGRCVLFLDDDIEFRLAAIPGSTDALAVGSEDPENSFFANPDEIEKCHFVNEDVIGLHEKLLNVGPAELLSSIETTFDFASHKLGRRLESGRARVIASQMGVIGDCGLDAPFGYYLRGPETWSRLVRSEELYQAAITNRLVLDGSKRFLVTPLNHCHTHCLGLDNTQGLPPFLPVMRGEDGVFGLLVNKCVPGSLFSLIPRAILHAPEPAREFPPKAALQFAGRLALSETIMSLISAAGMLSGRDWAERAQTLGRSLQELRLLQDRDLHERLQWVIDPLLTRFIQIMEKRIENSSADEFWTRDVRQIRDALVDSLSHVSRLAPVDLLATFGETEAVRRFRDVTAKFADVLEVWPDLVALAKRQFSC